MSKTVKQHGIIIALYLLVVIIMSLPAILSINTELIGNGGDPWQVVWRFDDKLEIIKQDISNNGIGSAIRNEIGGGEPRLVNLSVWPWMWAHLLFGEPMGYNIIWLFSFVLSGYSMFLLISYLFQREKIKRVDAVGDKNVTGAGVVELAPAFIAGLVYMLMPFHVAHAYGHFGAMQIQWIPLAMLSFFMLIDRPTVMRVVSLAVLMGVQAWTEHHYILWLGVFMGWFLIYSAVSNRKQKWNRRVFLYFVLLGGLLVFLIIIPYWPTIQLAMQANSVIDLGDEQLIRFSADPLAYFVPAPFHPLWGRLANSLFGQHFTGNVGESTLFLGLLPTLLIIFYHQRIPKKQKIFWFATALLFGVISLGPRLHLMGYVSKLFMPYAIIKDLPVFSAVRTVVRVAVFVNVSWVILLSLVLRTQMKRTISVFVVFLVVLTEFLFWPMPTMSFQMPRVYKLIEKMDGRAIVEIPSATNYLAASRALYGSKVHKKDLINNIALERAVGAEAFLEARSMPSLRQLLYLRTEHILDGRDDFFRQDMAESLSDVTKWLDVQQIVVHQDSLSEKQRRAVVNLLEERAGLERITVDDVWLYETQKMNNGDGVFIARDDGWKRVALNKEKNQVTAEIEREAKLTVYNVNKENTLIKLFWTMNDDEAEKLKVVSDAELYDNWDKYTQVREVQFYTGVGKTVLKLINTGGGAIRIEEPRMSIINDEIKR